MLTTKLAFSCLENWDRMKVGLVSRYCENCKRDVQDFTNSSKEEVLQFLLSNRNSKVCGRIFKHQLDYRHDEILVTINSFLKKNDNSNLSFYLLALGTMILLSCSSNGDNSAGHTYDSSAFMLGSQDSDLRGNEPIHLHQNCKIDSLLSSELPVVGELVMDSLLTNDPHGVRILAEEMPEFVGGIESLVVYVKKNLEYPEWEKKAAIGGTIFVSFTVDRKGNIIDPKIIKSVPGSRNLEKAVLNLVSGMPKWKPGKHKGENVAVEFVLPIRFRL